ncbi:15935_t:CDS:2 [Funneliformis mosseae]|uniref:15935_t:CDS:1 n=1 Tax=Funneliformis mosseae TaxID=27381 RepID=A0A9N8Z931_FUNMO|nr:15935_t:CDS:2 [Funneliformis mosseae]
MENNNVSSVTINIIESNENELYKGTVKNGLKKLNLKYEMEILNDTNTDTVEKLHEELTKKINEELDLEVLL